jgi:cytochrome P450
MLYHTAALLEPRRGDPRVTASFEKTMTNGPDEADGPFTALDRLVMELFRTVSPNGGSLSTLAPQQQSMGGQVSDVVTPHLRTSMDPRHWCDPDTFNPDRYLTAPTSVDNDEQRSASAGLARCPFPQESLAIKDGRSVEVTNSAFGAVYGVVDGKPYPICDTAGYAPFGFGYRRCAGEYLTVEFIKEFLRRVWNEKLSFVKLDLEAPGKVPVNPGTVLDDDIAFQKAA